MTFTLSGGSYSGTTTTLPGGTYNIWAQYGGDSANGPSKSGLTQITVASEASGIAFNMFSGSSYYTPGNGPGTTVDYGTQLMLSALVAPSSQVAALQTCVISGTGCPSVNFTVPTGTVNFTDNGGALNTALINAEGDAEYNAPFTVGAHSVAASYAGDKSYNSSTASPIAFTVVKDTPQIFWGASNTNSTSQIITGQPTVFNVIVENTAQFNIYNNSNGATISPVPVASPTGTVTLSSSPSGISGTLTLSAGVDPSDGAPASVGTITLPSTLAAGNYTVTFTYSGDGNYFGESGPGPFQVVATSGLASTTAATMAGIISPNSTITITGTVTGQTGHPAPTGGIILFSSGTGIGSISIAPGATGSVSTFSLTLNSQTLFQGANFVTLQYTGDATYAPSAVTLNNGNPISNPLSDFTLIPNTTIVPVTAGSNGTTTINLASVNGFSGTVNLACAAATGVTCTVPASATLTNGGSTTATLTVNAPSGVATGNYNVRITGTDTTGQYIHTLGMTAAVSGTTSGTPGFTLANSGTITVAQGATTGNTITATPTNGFTGAITLGCAVTTSPTGATSPVTCAIPTPVTITSGAQTAALTVSSTATTTAGAYAVTVTGTSGSITQTTVVSVTVTSTSSAYALSSNPSTLSVSPGATSGNTSVISVTPSGGFAGTVNLTCAITPTAASDPASCALSSPSVTITSGAVTSTLTIGTTAATAFNTPLKLFWPSTGGVVLAVLFFFGVPRRRRNWLAMLGLLLLFVSGVAIGCGGGSSSGGGTTPSNPGTTAGTYTVTVTGTSGANTKATTVTLTVL